MRRTRGWGVTGVAGLAILGIAWEWHFAVRNKTQEHIADLFLTSPLNLPGGNAAPSDAYDIYSALYQEASPEPLVFVEKSETDIPQVDGTCLRPLSSDEREMSDAFAAANRQSHLWLPRFHIAQGYSLISETEAAQARSCMDSHFGNRDLCGRFEHTKHLRYLGVPGFNRAHTHALVSVIKLCGRFCGSGGLFVVEKTGDGWRRSAATSFTQECSWMY